MMKYKGYLGHAIYDADAKLFHGEVIGLKDVITFQGTNVKNWNKYSKILLMVILYGAKSAGKDQKKPFPEI